MRRALHQAMRGRDRGRPPRVTLAFVADAEAVPVEDAASRALAPAQQRVGVGASGAARVKGGAVVGRVRAESPGGRGRRRG
ncbi:hypothetical protein BJP39_17375 [Streptomyces sp. CC77]|nr:hypothetical protein BJP39_17375 [Streptomyces sp. CC77]